MHRLLENYINIIIPPSLFRKGRLVIVGLHRDETRYVIICNAIYWELRFCTDQLPALSDLS
jgi:hypothetical protein